jgi:tRNA threonylcarbamoyladenosine biosynthesis protein TsaB
MSVRRANVLAIDTSGSFCSVAVRNGSGTVTAMSSEGSGDHFEQLPLLVARVCADAGIATTDIRSIWTGVGPGSFTGLRIGMSFVKGLAWSLRVPLIGCSSLAGAAAATMSRDSSSQRVVVLADARRDEVFAAAYTRGAQVVEERPPCIVPVGELKGAEWSKPGTRWVTPQRDFALAGVPLAPERDVATGILLLDGPEAKPFDLGEIAALEPTYLRAVAAKTIEERKQGA